MKFCSFAVIPRSLKLGDLRTTGSRRLLCYSSAKLGKSMDVKPKSGRVLVKVTVFFFLRIGILCYVVIVDDLLI